MPKIARLGAWWLVLVMPAFAQETNAAGDAKTSAAQGASDQAQRYEAVSIRPNKTGSSSGGTRALPDGFVWTNTQLSTLVRGAYGIIEDSQVTGMPDWARRENYDILAKVDEDTAERWRKLTFKERFAQEQPLQRALLAERCAFKAHEEIKELPVYDLVVAKGGVKMKEAPPDEPATTTISGNHMTARAMTTETIALTFAGAVGRIIVDKTGLGETQFDIELSWSPDDRVSASDTGPSLFTALQEQLGLKLVPAKAAENVLVIDRMERPSPN